VSLIDGIVEVTDEDAIKTARHLVASDAFMAGIKHLFIT
jgi:cysteine synthase